MKGDGVGMALGMSLTSDDVVWVLVDDKDGSVVDHDVIDVHSDTQIASAAARGAHAIATNGGYDVHRVRLTWSDDVAHDGLRLRTRLRCMGFRTIETIPFSSAVAVMVQPDMEPGLALAYGAAFAKVSPGDAITVPIARRIPAKRRLTRGRIAVACVGAAAAAGLGGLLLTSGSMPQAERAATAAAQPVRPDAGWVAVPAPADGAANVVRKVVESPEETTDEVAEPVRRAYPVQSDPTTAATAVPSAAPVAAAVPAPAGVPHLPEGVPHLAVPPAAPVVAAPPAEAPPVLPAEAPLAVPAPEAVPTGQPHLPSGQTPTGPVPHMTDPANLFTAVP